MIRVIIAALALLVAIPSLGAELTPWNAMPETNPLDFGTLHMSPFEAWNPPHGSWWTSTTTTYFNVWSGSWHPRTIHVELHREHQPLGSDELRTLEERGPTDHIYQLDAEGWRTDLAAARSFGWGTVLVRASAFGIGAPRWDAIGESAHQILHADKMRTIFSRSQTLVYFRTPEHRVELRDETRGFHVGNPSISVGMPLHFSSSFDHRIIVAAQIPVAQHDSTNIAGTGGWDAGVRWVTTGRVLGLDTLAGAGYTRVDRHATFYGFPRADLWHGMAELSHRIGRFALTAGARVDRSVLAGAIRGESSRPDLNVVLGLAAPFRNGSLSFSFGENVPSAGLGADWSFHLQYTTALRRR